MKYVILILIFLANYANAEDPIYTVCEVGAEGTNDVYLKTCEPYVGTQNCSNGGEWIHWTLSNPADTAKLANAQASLISGKQVVVRVQGCSAGFDHVFMLRLKK